MEDDFNTADAIAAIFDFVKFINTNTDGNSSKEYLEKLHDRLATLADVLGIIVDRDEEMLDEEIEALIEERQTARKNRILQEQTRSERNCLRRGSFLKTQEKV